MGHGRGRSRRRDAALDAEGRGGLACRLPPPQPPAPPVVRCALPRHRARLAAPARGLLAVTLPAQRARPTSPPGEAEASTVEKLTRRIRVVCGCGARRALPAASDCS